LSSLTSTFIIFQHFIQSAFSNYIIMPFWFTILAAAKITFHPDNIMPDIIKKTPFSLGRWQKHRS